VAEGSPKQLAQTLTGVPTELFEKPTCANVLASGDAGFVDERACCQRGHVSAVADWLTRAEARYHVVQRVFC